MSTTESRGRWWITYFLLALPVHLVLIGLAGTEQFGESVLQHSWVRITIGVIATTIILSLPWPRRSATVNAGS